MVVVVVVQLTSSGQPFWSGPKRCPQVINFQPDDELHADFVVAATYLFAKNYGIKGNTSYCAFTYMNVACVHEFTIELLAMTGGSMHGHAWTCTLRLYHS